MKNTIKSRGVRLSSLSRMLNLSNHILNSKLENPYLEEDFIKRIGKFIKYDFSKDFNFEKSADDFFDFDEINKKLIPEFFNKKTYLNTLEVQNKILFMLAKISTTKDCEQIEKEISKFIENLETKDLSD